MDRDLWKLLVLIVFVLVFGGWQGLFNVAYGAVFMFSLVILILITFYKWDLILAGLKWISGFFIRRRSVCRHSALIFERVIFFNWRSEQMDDIN